MSDLRLLAFHIGMPKTATTTLQTHVFPALPSYVGKHYGKTGQDARSEHDFHFQARRRALGFTRWEKELEDWIAGLRASGLREVFFSDESLSSWTDGEHTARWPFLEEWRAGTRTRPHPVVRFLEHARGCVGEDTEVRVILTVRNQADFMGSLYAQVQPFLQDPGQGDFDRKVAELLSCDDPFFDFAALTEELDATVGSANCLVLLFEDGVDVNARRILGFLGVSPDIAPLSMPSANVKKAGERDWQYRQELPLLKTGLFGRYRKALEARALRFFGQQRGLRAFLARIDRLSQRIVPVRQVVGERITVSERTQAEIRAHFAGSNARLAERLGRNLSSLGY